ncbi:hypothetical protein ACFL59_05720, partial [Planctomycetota bacterium]
IQQRRWRSQLLRAAALILAGVLLGNLIRPGWRGEEPDRATLDRDLAHQVADVDGAPARLAPAAAPGSQAPIRGRRPRLVLGREAVRDLSLQRLITATRDTVAGLQAPHPALIRTLRGEALRLAPLYSDADEEPVRNLLVHTAALLTSPRFGPDEAPTWRELAEVLGRVRVRVALPQQAVLTEHEEAL